ncbi:head-tail adaptor protein [uncultured Maritimibacter sp.]|jgi:head-tail adaptor|uniref:phage head completion protein n=1 Tax=uncultured Maritimibacter sp. TaxID=991866 RepID=UPI0026283BB1|nr:head-tail adaptor protein [uncultured Maritimibacter sp.]
MAVAIGQLDRKAVFYRYATDPGAKEVPSTLNALGEEVRVSPSEIELPPSFCAAWAKREDLSDQERLANDMQIAGVTSRWIVASTASTRQITPADVMVVDGRRWNITGVKESLRGARHQYLELTATEAL